MPRERWEKVGEGRSNWVLQVTEGKDLIVRRMESHRRILKESEQCHFIHYSLST